MKEKYLGITIDTSRDHLISESTLRMLEDRYFVEGETSAQHAFARAASAFADDLAHAQRIYDYASNHWFMFSTPILSNAGASRGMPISCFLSFTGDSRKGLSDHYDELIWLVSNGGGVGGYWGDVRSDGQSTSNGSKSSGSIPFLKVVDAQILAFNQGTCYTPGHEVLTEGGWVKFEDLKGTETVAQLDEDGQYSWYHLQPGNVVREMYEGPMYEILHGDQRQMMVTANHNLVILKEGKYQLVRAELADFSDDNAFWVRSGKYQDNPERYIHPCLGGRRVSHGDPNIWVRDTPIALTSLKKVAFNYKGPVHCVEVPKKRLFVRYEGVVSVCGNTRRGSYAAYSNISHPEIEEFLGMRKPTGGDINRKCLNLNHAVNITDDFMRIIERCQEDPNADDSWDLIDPHSGNVTNTVSAKDLWQKVVETRVQTGEPYIHFIDRSNEFLPASQKALGLKVNQSNLCVEITQATNALRTAVCCLSSTNLELWDEWKDHPTFIGDIVRFLDNVLTFFINQVFKESTLETLDELAKTHQSPEALDCLMAELVRSEHSSAHGLRKAAWSAHRERSIGLGAMGFHSYLQRKNIPFESAIALSVNNKMFAHIKEQALAESQKLAVERGEAPDMAGTGLRFAHLLAIAPNASSSYICGGTSPSIELSAGNAFVGKTLSGSFLVENKYLKAELAKIDKDTPEVWKSIMMMDGSVQHLEFLDEWTKGVFKTAMEVDQEWVIEHAAVRQPYICQSQSLNLFFRPDEEIKYLHDVHFLAWKRGLKTLYYCRSASLKRTENVSVKSERKQIDLSGEGCIACEG